MRRRASQTSLLVAALILSAIPVASVQHDDPVNPLESATGLRCRFVVTAVAAWKGGLPSAQLTPQELEIVITDIDLQGGTAEVRAQGGRRFATATLSSGSLYVMQIDRGELNVASVFATESFQKRLKATYTRQAFVYLTVPPLNDAPVVTQSYGDCEIVSAERR